MNAKILIFALMMIFTLGGFPSKSLGAEATSNPPTNNDMDGPSDEDSGSDPTSKPHYVKRTREMMAFEETRKINARIAPVNLLLGQLNGTVDFGISPRWTIGPEIVAYHGDYNGYITSVFAIGVRANYKLTGKAFTNGWYLGPYFLFYALGVSNYGVNSLSATTSGSLIGAVAGYQWLWRSGFNINAGLGAEVASFNHVHVSDNSGNSGDVAVPTWGTGVVLEFTLGWLF